MTRRYKSERHHALESQYPSEPEPYPIRWHYTPGPKVKRTWWRRALNKLIDLMT